MTFFKLLLLVYGIVMLFICSFKCAFEFKKLSSIYLLVYFSLSLIMGYMVTRYIYKLIFF